MECKKEKNPVPGLEIAEYHKKKIVDIVDEIEDAWVLWQIHRAVINITKEDG